MGQRAYGHLLSLQFNSTVNIKLFFFFFFFLVGNGKIPSTIGQSPRQ